MRQVLKKLSDHKVTGLFIIDGGSPIGWVDLYDVMIYLVYILNEYCEGEVGDIDFDEVFASENFMETHTASDIISLSLID